VSERTTAPERPPLRLLIVYEGYSRYGAPMLARTLVESLGDYVQVTVVAPNEETAQWIAADRLDARTIVTEPLTGWRSFRKLFAYRRILRRERPDIVQLCLPTPRTATRYLAPVAHTVRGARVVAVENAYHRSSRTRARVSTRLTATAIDAHVAVGENVARIIETGYGMPSRSIRAIPCAVPDRPVRQAKRLGLAPVVGSVTRLSHEKGLDIALRAMAAVPETTFVLVGHGDDECALQELAQELGRGEHTHFVGFQAEPQDYLAGIDVFVQASRRDAMSLATLEAMAAGLPVVATDVGSTEEAVVDGVTGLLVPPEDVAALHDAITRLLGDPALRARLGAAGRARYEARFTPQRHARAYEALYDELVPPATRARRTDVPT